MGTQLSGQRADLVDMIDVGIPTGDLVDNAPDALREQYDVQMTRRRRAWVDAWRNSGLHPTHPEDGLAEAHRAAWQEALAAGRAESRHWEPSLLEEALMEAVLLSAQLPHWGSDLAWGDVHIALYRQARHEEPTALGMLLSRSLRITLPKTLERIVKRAQEAAESLGAVVAS